MRELDRSRHIGCLMAVVAWNESRAMRARIYYLGAIAKKEQHDGTGRQEKDV